MESGGGGRDQIPLLLLLIRSPLLSHTVAASLMVGFIFSTSSLNYLYSHPAMDTLVASLQPQRSFAQSNQDEYDQGAYPNLDSRGAIAGMALPRVADVSAQSSVFLSLNADISQLPFSPLKQIPSRPTPREGSSSHTVPPPLLSSSRAVSS